MKFIEKLVIDNSTRGSLAWAKKNFSPLSYAVTDNHVHAKAGNHYILSSDRDENNPINYDKITGGQGHHITIYSSPSQVACPGWMSKAAKEWYDEQVKIAFDTLLDAYNQVDK